MSEQQSHVPGYRRRLGIVIGAVVAVGALLVGAFFWLTGEEDTVPESSIELSTDDQREVQQITENFIQDVGTFGYDLNEVDGDNIYDLMDLAQVQDYEALSLIATSRIATYLNARETYIAENSPLYYPSSQVYEWNMPSESENVFRYSVQNIQTTVPETAQVTHFQGSDRRSVVVPVVFDGEQTHINRGVTDSSWDGTHPVFERSTPGMNASVVLLEIDDEWKVYNIRNESHAHLLATWENAMLEHYSPDLFADFEQESVLEPSEPFDFQEWIESRNLDGGGS